jgi:primosomal protein N' (replication factor Y)
MPYVDIVFPLKLRPLTYRCPAALEGKVKEGMIVSAPLKNKRERGIVISQNVAPPSAPTKEFFEICGDAPAISRSMLKLLVWMSEYYLASAGSVLQQTMPKELFARVKSRTRTTSGAAGAPEIPDLPADEIAPLLAAAAGKKYRTFLVHAPTIRYEYSLVSSLLHSSLKNTLVIFPEISGAEAFFRAAGEWLGERGCLLHGGMSRGLRSESIEGIISGKFDVVIGTRAALFAPMKTVSLIAVLHEHSTSYKLEEGIRYNVRDVAVMRGFMEKATVMLSSITPSLESYFNALTGKYLFLSPPPPAKRPRIKIVDMRYAKKVRPGISKDVFDAATNKIRAGKRIMFVINRRGYATLLLCSDCGHRETCDNCEIPLVMHKDERVLKCHYCGTARSVPDRCSRCGSVHLELLGTGTEKFQEEIEGLFGIDTLRFDSDKAKKKSDVSALLQRLEEDPAKVIIGTKMMTGKIAVSGEFSMAAVMNTDVSLGFPDFRSAEKAYREVAAIASLIEPGGEVLVQTRLPGSSLFKCLRSGDYASFMNEELSARKELSYPPYAKLITITVIGNTPLASSLIRKIISLNPDIEVLGPTFSRSPKKEEQFSVLLKSAGRKALNEAARTVLDRYGAMKGIKIVIDVDPA